MGRGGGEGGEIIWKVLFAEDFIILDYEYPNYEKFLQ